MNNFKSKLPSFVLKWLFLFFSFLLTTSYFPLTVVHADVPARINYQGRLKESGLPFSGAKTMNFRLWNTASGGVWGVDGIWESGDVEVAVSSGLFNYVLAPDPNVDWRGKTPYLEITLDAGAVTLTPREQLSAAPYALYAASAAYAFNTGGWTQTGNVVRSSDDNYFVGIGTKPLYGKVTIAGKDDQLVIFSTSSEANNRIWVVKADKDIGNTNMNRFEIITANDGWTSWQAGFQMFRVNEAITQVAFPTGNIRIGGGEAREKLEVNGNIRIQSNILLDGTDIKRSSNTYTSWTSLMGGESELGGAYLQLAGVGQTAVTDIKNGGAQLMISSANPNAVSYFRITTREHFANWPPMLIMNGYGKVGINTYDPYDSLDLSTGAVRFYNVTNSTYTTIFGNTNGLNVYTSKLAQSGGGFLRIGEIWNGMGLYSGDGPGTGHNLGFVAPANKVIGLSPNGGNPFVEGVYISTGIGNPNTRGVTVGIGTTDNTANLFVVGTSTVTSNAHIGGDLTVNGSIISGGGGLLTGSGSPGAVPKFTGASALGESTISDDGVNVTFTGNLYAGTTVQSLLFTGSTVQAGTIVDSAGRTEMTKDKLRGYYSTETEPRWILDRDLGGIGKSGIGFGMPGEVITARLWSEDSYQFRTTASVFDRDVSDNAFTIVGGEVSSNSPRLSLYGSDNGGNAEILTGGLNRFRINPDGKILFGFDSVNASTFTYSTGDLELSGRVVALGDLTADNIHLYSGDITNTQSYDKINIAGGRNHMDGAVLELGGDLITPALGSDVKWGSAQIVISSVSIVGDGGYVPMFRVRRRQGWQDLLVVKADGRVGIMASDPQAMLHLSSSSALADQYMILLSTAAGGHGDAFVVKGNGSISMRGDLGGYKNGETTPRWTMSSTFGGSDNAGIGFGPGGSAALDTALWRASNAKFFTSSLIFARQVDNSALYLWGGTVSSMTASIELHGASDAAPGKMLLAVPGGSTQQGLNIMRVDRVGAGDNWTPLLVVSTSGAMYFGDTTTRSEGKIYASTVTIMGDLKIAGSGNIYDMNGSTKIVLNSGGNTVISDTVTVSGPVRIGNAIDNPVGSTGLIYYNSSAKRLRIYNGAWVDISSGSAAIGGSGSNNTIAKWTGTTNLGDSIIADNGANMVVTGGEILTGQAIVYGSATVANAYGILIGTKATGSGALSVNADKIQGWYQAEAEPRWSLERDMGGVGLAGIGFGAGGVTAMDTKLWRQDVLAGEGGVLRTNAARIERDAADSFIRIVGGPDPAYDASVELYSRGEADNEGKIKFLLPFGANGKGLEIIRASTPWSTLVKITTNAAIMLGEAGTSVEWQPGIVMNEGGAISYFQYPVNNAKFINSYSFGFHGYNDGATNGLNTYVSGVHGINLFSNNINRIRVRESGDIVFGWDNGNISSTYTYSNANLRLGGDLTLIGGDIIDTGGATRITVAAGSPHITLTGDVTVTGTLDATVANTTRAEFLGDSDFITDTGNDGTIDVAYGVTAGTAVFTYGVNAATGTFTYNVTASTGVFTNWGRDNYSILTASSIYIGGMAQGGLGQLVFREGGLARPMIDMGLEAGSSKWIGYDPAWYFALTGDVGFRWYKSSGKGWGTQIGQLTDTGFYPGNQSTRYLADNGASITVNGGPLQVNSNEIKGSDGTTRITLSGTGNTPNVSAAGTIGSTYGINASTAVFSKWVSMTDINMTYGINAATGVFTGVGGYSITTTSGIYVGGNLYVNGATKSGTTLIVAASNSSSATFRADYRCDGVNDQTEVNAAIDVLSGKGGTVLLLEGTYNLGGTIALDQENITLLGLGKGSVLNSVSGNAVTVTGMGVRVENISIYATNGRGVFFNAASSGTVRDCYIRTTGGGIDTVHIDGASENCTVESNRITGVAGGGISVYSIGSNNRITGNQITRGGMGIQGSGSNLIIANNIVIGASNHGIYLSGGTNSILTGNISQNNGGSGINVNTTEVAVTGNMIFNNGSDNLKLDTSESNCVISGNFINAGSTSRQGLTIFGSNNTITGNSIYNCATAIYLGYSSNHADNNTIDGNKLISCTNGFYLSAYACNNALTNNDMSTCTNSFVGSQGIGTFFGAGNRGSDGKWTGLYPSSGTARYINNDDVNYAVGITSNLAVAGYVKTGNWANDPPGITGSMYYNTSTKRLKLYDATGWVNVSTGIIPMGNSSERATYLGDSDSIVDTGNDGTINIGYGVQAATAVITYGVKASTGVFTGVGGYSITTTSGIYVGGNLFVGGATKNPASKIVAAANSSSATFRADYRCDGNNDQTEINAAIDALSGTGGIVYLLEGTFTLGAAITVDQANITLMGSGAGTIISNPSGDTTVSITANRARLQNISIAGTGAGYAVHFNGVSSGTVSNCHISKSGAGDTVVFQNSENCTLEASRVIKNAASNALINLNASNNIKIQGNHVMGGAFSIYTTGAPKNISINNNTFMNSNGDSILFLGVTDSEITGNSIQENAAQGVDLDANCSNIVISGNNFKNNAPTAVGGAVYINGDYIAFTGNTVYNSRDGIKIETSANFCIVSGNTFIGAGQLGWGVTLTGTNNTFNTNTITDYSVGLKVYTGSYNSITGNRIYNCVTAFSADSNTKNNIFMNNDMYEGGTFTNNAVSTFYGGGNRLNDGTWTGLYPSSNTTRYIHNDDIHYAVGITSNLAVTGYVKTGNLSADPVGVLGSLFYNTTTKRLKLYDGTGTTGWVDVSTGTVLSGETMNRATFLGASNGITDTGNDGTINVSYGVQAATAVFTYGVKATTGVFTGVGGYSITATSGIYVGGNLYVGGAVKNPATIIIAASNTSSATFRADYRCDGAADQVEINNAIDALGVTGGVIHLLEGTFNITGDINIDQANISIVGSGASTIISGNNAIVANSLRPTLINFSISNTVGTALAVSFSGVSSGTISNLWISKGAGGDGIKLESNSSNCIVSDCKIIGNGSGGAGFALDNCNTVSLLGNLVSRFYFGIWTGNSPTNITITGNTFLANAAESLNLAGCTEWSITNNIIKGAASHGIYLSATCSDISIVGNSIIDNGNAGGENGIDLDGADRCSITGNTFSGNYENSVMLNGGAQYNSVTGNTMYGTGTGNGSGVVSNGSYNNISGNAISNHWAGVGIWGGDYNSITSNKITSCSNGFYFDNASDNNTVSLNDFYGCSNLGSAGNGVFYGGGNRLPGGDWSGIYASSNTHSRIYDILGTGMVFSTNVYVANLGQIQVANMASYGTGNAVYVDANGMLNQNPSSKRYKDNIKPLKRDFGSILRLEPRSFNIKNGPADIGYIAEEVEALGLKDFVVYDKEKHPNGLRYEKLPIYMLEIVKQQQKAIEELQNQNNKLEERLNKLEKENK